jgi:hypothetical protein
MSHRWHDSAVTEALASATEIAEYCAANAATVDCNGAFPALEFELIAKVGQLEDPLHRDLGGLGFGIEASVTRELLMLLKQIGRGNLAVGRVYEGHVNALQTPCN